MVGGGSCLLRINVSQRGAYGAAGLSALADHQGGHLGGVRDEGGGEVTPQQTAPQVDHPRPHHLRTEGSSSRARTRIQAPHPHPHPRYRSHRLSLSRPPYPCRLPHPRPQPPLPPFSSRYTPYPACGLLDRGERASASCCSKSPAKIRSSRESPSPLACLKSSA